MKFVIRSLLFVNLLLQMTNSLRQCFNQDQNIMITIILLAFSVIGLIGLVIGNRFILIIFSASMTLILIASITIYAIGKTEEDTLRPKVPYYTTREAYQDTIEKRFRGVVNMDEKRDHKFRSLVDRWLTNNSSKFGREEAMRAKTRHRSNSRSRNSNGTTPIIQQQQQRLDLIGAPKSRLSLTKTAPIIRQQMQQYQATKIPPALPLDEQSDEPSLEAVVSEVQGVNLRTLASAGQQQQGSASTVAIKPDANQKLPAPGIGNGGKRAQLLPIVDHLKHSDELLAAHSGDHSDDQLASQDGGSGGDATSDDSLSSDDKVESEQWVAYERYLYEQYLNIVSQSIDLVMHTILAAWMALLLDEDSDQCFGPKTSGGLTGGGRSVPGITRAGSKAPPVYNYNGVRYSIRPDVDDSLARVVVN